MKTIPLTQGKFAIVDDDMFEELNKYKWCALKRDKIYYAGKAFRDCNNKKTLLLMHRYISKANNNQEVDHADCDGLNNQLSNLRICTSSENKHNTRIRKNNSTGYKGVYFHKYRKYYYSTIMSDRKEHYLGSFDNPIDAANCYDLAAIKLHGEYANTNFKHIATN